MSSFALGPERPPASSRRKVGFIGHPQDMEMFRGYVRYLRPDKTYRDELLLKLFEWTPSYKVTGWADLGLPGKDPVDAILALVPFLPEMRDIKLRRIVEKIEQAIAICAEEGCTVAALGAFTSIVLQGQEADFASKFRIRLTSGNGLTSALIVESIEELARRFDIDLSSSSMAIIGASGDIGSACFGYFADRVAELRVTARGMTPLHQLVDRVASRTTARVRVTSGVSEAIRDARFVIFVTSSPGQLVRLEDLSPGTIACDASAPVNVQTAGELRPDVFIYHGGIAQLPFALHTGFELGLASPSTFYGCQVEGLLIAADPSLPDSWGRGNIGNDTIRRYREAIEDVGVQVAYSQGRHCYTDREFDGYRSRLAWHGEATPRGLAHPSTREARPWMSL